MGDSFNDFKSYSIPLKMLLDLDLGLQVFGFRCGYCSTESGKISSIYLYKWGVGGGGAVNVVKNGGVVWGRFLLNSV